MYVATTFLPTLLLVVITLPRLFFTRPLTLLRLLRSFLASNFRIRDVKTKFPVRYKSAPSFVCFGRWKQAIILFPQHQNADHIIPSLICKGNFQKHPCLIILHCVVAYKTIKVNMFYQNSRITLHKHFTSTEHFLQKNISLLAYFLFLNIFFNLYS